jgi:hypothetical protein
MKKLLVIFLCIPFAASAQNFHFSARFGLAGYQGDLKEHSVSLSQTKLMGSIGVQYDLSEHLAARSYLTLTSLKGDDKKGMLPCSNAILIFKPSFLTGSLRHNTTSLV